MGKKSSKHLIRTETDMEIAVWRHLNKRKVIAARQVRVGPGQFDVVAYDKDARIFKIIECKLHRRLASTGKTFGQALTYLTILEGRGFEFVDAASWKLPRMGYGQWREATSDGKKIKVAIYVALTHKATMQPEFPALRVQYPKIGIIRVKPSGQCRDVLKGPGGIYDSNGAKALPQTIRL